MSARVFVTRRLADSALQILYDAVGEDAVRVHPHDRVIQRDELLAGVRGVEAILSILTERIDAEVLDAAGPQLKIVANYAVGYDNIDVAAATERGIAVTNTPDVLTESTADLTWALILGAARRVGEGERFLRAGKWTTWAPNLLCGVDVHGKTLGIYGLGRIGAAVARRARGFNMRVLYAGRSRKLELEPELRAVHVDMATLLTESDIVSLHCPLTPETRHAFGAAEFRAMKPTAVFVNTTRGPVVDEAALASALRAGEIAYAGLDVFEQEPKVHPDLLACENAFLLPHLGSATVETRTRMAEIAAENIAAMLTGGRPMTCVNPEVLT